MQRNAMNRHKNWPKKLYKVEKEEEQQQKNTMRPNEAKAMELRQIASIQLVVALFFLLSCAFQSLNSFNPLNEFFKQRFWCFFFAIWWNVFFRKRFSHCFHFRSFIFIPFWLKILCLLSFRLMSLYATSKATPFLFHNQTKWIRQRDFLQNPMHFYASFYVTECMVYSARASQSIVIWHRKV